MEYPRTSYLNKLIAHVGNDQVKVITGMRRCGKSYLLNKIFARELTSRGVQKDHIIQVDFDGYRNRSLRNPDRFFELLDAQIYDQEAHYLLLDEVQLLEDFPEVLNDLIRMDNVDVYATGSNAHLLSKDVVTEFRGRAQEIPLRPLSFSEFMTGYAGDKRDAYDEYALYGGLPAVATIENPADKAEYLTSIYEETYIRDIVERKNIRNESDLIELVDVLSSNIGCLSNPLKIANTFKSEKRSSTGRDTIERYISYLEDSFLFEKAVRYDIKGRKYIGADAKYYATDMGLRNARMHFRQYEASHALENIIYNELRGRGYRVDVGVVPARITEKDGRQKRISYECDFVCNLGHRRYYIQSAYSLPDSRKIDQEQESLLRIDDSFKKLIVSRDGMPPHYNENGIFMMNVYDFLLDPNSLDF